MSWTKTPTRLLTLFALTAVFLFCGILGTMPSVGAQVVEPPSCTIPDRNEEFLGLPKWYKYLDGQTTGGVCNPTIDDASDALPIGITVLEGAIRLAGLVAVVMIFIGGFRFITSQGNPEAAKSARMTAINALIGLAIVMVSTVVVSYIGRNIGASP